MINVFQCARCKTIVGDTDVSSPSGADAVEITHPKDVSQRNGRVHCPGCNEAIGNEDRDGKIWFTAKLVSAYVVQSSIRSVADTADESRKRRKAENDDDGSGYVSIKQFQRFRLEYMKEMSDVKEFVMQMCQRDGR